MSNQRRLRSDQLTPYEKSIENILKKSWQAWSKDPVMLAQTSLLASPYFLSHLLPSEGLHPNSAALGHALLDAIRQAAQSFWQEAAPQNYDGMKATLDAVRNNNEHDHYHAVHLELRFFQDFLHPRTKAAIFEEYLLIARKEENILFKGTIRRLGQALLNLLGPPSNPLPLAPKESVGVRRNLTQLQSWLQAKQTVSLTGQGGVGKSTLATLLAHSWPHGVFWYTVRPGLNDRLSSFLFDLGHFLHKQGSANLWKLALSEGGVVQNRNVALALLYEDLVACQERMPLFIIDEIDRLYSADPDLAKPQHVEILEFLDAMRDRATLLLVGQQAILESENYFELTGLVPFQVAELLQLRSISPSAQDVETLHRATQGNPRLLLLCMALYESEQAEDSDKNPKHTFANTVAIVSQSPGFGPILNRLWDRLTIQQRELLQRLSVYPGNAPRRYWPTDRDEKLAVASALLIERRLVEERAQGSVGMLPALQMRIYTEKLTPDLRRAYHLDAAIIVAQLSEYTDGAYHFDKGGEPAKAIQLWYPMMEAEIQRGQSGVAYNIFINMAQRSIPKKERQALAEIKARLHELYGGNQEALDIINQEDWSNDTGQRIRILRLKGQFEAALGYPHLAVRSYRDSIETTRHLMAQTTVAYCRLASTYIREGELSNAENSVLVAEQEVLILRSALFESNGKLREAYEISKQALDIAQSLDNLGAIALGHARLGSIQTRREQFDDAIWHIEQAKLYYERMGDRLESAKADNTLTATYLEIGNYEAAIAMGEQAVRFFEAIKNPYFAAATLATVAEAYFKLDHYEQAERMANRVLEHEEAHAAPYAYFTLGLVREARDNLQEAALYFERSLEIAASNGDIFMEAFARRNYGKALCQIGEVEKGLEQLHRALVQFEQMEKMQEVEATQQVLSTVTT